MDNCTKIHFNCTPGMVIGYIYIASFIAIFGIISNILNILVLRRLYSCGPPFNYMFGLAFVDIVPCVLLLPVSIMRCMALSPQAQLFNNIFKIYLFVPFTNTFGACSVWITLAMSTERLVLFSCGMKAKTSKARYVISLLLCYRSNINFRTILFALINFHTVIQKS